MARLRLAAQSFKERFAGDFDLTIRVSSATMQAKNKIQRAFSAPTLRSLLFGTEIGFIILPALTVTAGWTRVLQRKSHKARFRANKRRRREFEAAPVRRERIPLVPKRQPNATLVLLAICERVREVVG